MKAGTKTIVGNVCMILAIGCLCAAAWNSALLTESTTRQWHAVAITAIEWIMGAMLSVSSMAVHWSNASRTTEAIPIDGDVLTIEQIEWALRDRIAADQAAMKEKILTRIGKVTA